EKCIYLNILFYQCFPSFIFFINFKDFCDADQCRKLEFTPEKTFDGRRLINHVIRIVEVLTMNFCDNMCYMEPDCVSINLYKRVSGHGAYKCELNNVTHESHEHDLEKVDYYVYHAAESACVDNPCNNNSTCQSGFTDKGYRCLCTAGFKGPRCKKDIDECAAGTQDCSKNAVCNNTKGSYNCSCKPGYSGNGRTCEDINECADGTSNCSADAMCDNTEGSYRCKCKPGFTGDGRTCKDIDECATGKTNCSADAVCNNTKGSYNCTCKEGYYGDGNICRLASTCKEIFDRNVSKTSGEVTLHLDSKPISVFCHMGDFGCGDGGWTLIMKINGSERTFHYDSQFWSNRSAYNLRGGKTGFDLQETKLPTFWTTSFSKICLGMKISNQLRFIVINKRADSLHSLIADGKYRNTSLSRETWKWLIGSQASLQPKCSREGFNAVGDSPSFSKARIGITANQQNDCSSCNSRIGFGTGGLFDDSNTCGNEATLQPDNGNKHIKAIGSEKSGEVTLHLDYKPISVFCYMTDFGCGDGGWTPIVRINGNKSTFHYDSQFWSNRIAYNLPGSKTGFDSQETKLPTYWNTSFSKICLGMKIDNQLRFIVINKQANSLYSLIADGQYRHTTLGPGTWKTLVGSQASLQPHCNKEGFNAVGDNTYQSKARIGITANQQNDCSSCDSRIGFGTGGRHDDSNTCGNEATRSPDNGNKHIKAMGYILVHLDFTPEKAFNGKRLINHVIRIVEVMKKEFCENVCFLEPNCVSINLNKRVDGNGNYECELNNATHEGHEDELKKEENYFYHAAESACVKNHCKNNATCQSGFTEKGFRCLCTAGFKGQNCDQDVNECTEGSHGCSADAVCINTEGSYTCSCKPGYSGDGRTCKDVNECTEGSHGCSADAVCINTEGSYTCSCKPGYSGDGRTCKGLVFHSCKEILENQGSQENKAYPILVNNKKIYVYCHMTDDLEGCRGGGWTLVMKMDGTKEGFNVLAIRKNHSKARIGIIANDKDHCNTCDSRIGFGTGGIGDDSNTCGNEAKHGGDNGDKHIKTIGYILVQ
ncbi:hypothetical protein pdam_00012358, partial [Pocillopora damicornis]